MPTSDGSRCQAPSRKRHAVCRNCHVLRTTGRREHVRGLSPLEAVGTVLLQVLEAESRVQPAYSAMTASEKGGHACFAHSSNSRSVRQHSARPASGSIHTNVPLPPKWPNVRSELRVPVQWGDFAS